MESNAKQLACCRMSRRKMIALALGATVLAAPFQVVHAGDADGATYVYVGSYTKDPPGGGSNNPLGLSVFKFDPTTGALSPVQQVKSANPSFVALDPSQQHLYVENEIDDYEGQKSGSAEAYAAVPVAMAVGTEGSPTVAGPSGSPAARTGSAIPPTTSCATLSNADLSGLDARVTSAATVTRDGHAFCDVHGYISPVTQFEVLLPQETWRGDYLQEGCGGFCGHVDVNLQDPSRTSGYQAPYTRRPDR